MKTSALGRSLSIGLMIIVTLLLFLAVIYTGAVSIPADQITKVLLGGKTDKSTWDFIILNSRIPMAVTALLSGASLSVAGLIMQTTFRNPLAGPSILGISSGASLGVAVVLLCAPASIVLAPGSGIGGTSLILGAALLGAAAIIGILLLFSSAMSGALSLIIVGVMISYLASAITSLLNFFAPASDVKSFVMWGLGSYSSVTLEQLPWLAGIIVPLLIISVFMAKPLNALLLGERYAANIGYNIRGLRTMLLSVAGLLTAVITGFCGPIGFIGLIVPHIARMFLSTSNHNLLIVSSIICGAAISLLCTWISVTPHGLGVLPINAVTPLIGVPVILYIMIARKRLAYFN